MVILLKHLLDKGIRPVMAEKITILERTFTLKMKTLLTQRMLAMVNSQTIHVNRVYDCLQQENTKQQNQVQDLTRKLRSTVLAVNPPLTWTPTTTVPPASTIPDLRETKAEA